MTVPCPFDLKAIASSSCCRVVAADRISGEQHNITDTDAAAPGSLFVTLLRHTLRPAHAASCLRLREEARLIHLASVSLSLDDGSSNFACATTP